MLIYCICTQYLVGAPFALITASIRRGMAFSSSALLGLVSLIFLLTIQCCVDCGLQKTQWTNTSRWYGSPNHHWLWKLHTGLQATWILCLSTLPPDSGTFFFSKFPTSENRTLDHWATVQFFFSTAQVRCFWRCLWFRSGLVALFLKTSERGDSWCTDSSFSPLLVKLSQVFESALLDNILKLAVILVACAPFPTQILPSSQLCI